ncbi:MAG: hypothetical protein Kow0029_02390 [Candidatus Rifleibacteriota bacterium]
MTKLAKLWERHFKHRLKKALGRSFTARGAYSIPAEEEVEDAKACLLKSDFPKLFIVWDALGNGRLVGAFSSEEKVKEILKINPHYYRYYVCEPDKPTITAIDWLDAKHKAKLLGICKASASELKY